MRVVEPVLSPGFKMTELGPIPVEWEVVSLGRVCKLGRENVDPQELPEIPYVGLEHIDSGEPKLRRWGSSSEVRSSKHHFVSGDVLYGKLRPYLDKAVLAEFEGVCSTDILVLKANADCALPEFLVYLLHTQRFRSYAISTTSGTNLPRTRWTSLKDFKLALPPLPEQRRIAHVLNTIQRAIAAQDAVIAAARELKRSLMQRLFTYGPDPEPAPTKETEIGEIPEHWEVARLGEVATVKGGKRLPKGHSFSEHPTPFPYIRVTDFANWSVDLTGLKHLTPEDREKIERYIITTDDVYISIAGTIGLVGTIPESLNGANLTENAARIIINDKQRLDKHYLVGFLASDSGQKQIDARTTKTSQPKLALARIRQLPVALPPLAEQREIAHILRAVNRKIAAEEQRKAALQALFKSMLHQLMTGRIRV